MPQILTNNDPILVEFRAEGKSTANKLGLNIETFGDTLPLQIFEWREKAENGYGTCQVRDVSVATLESCGDAQVRVILAPRDVPVPDFVTGLGDLFEKFEIPSAFLEENRASQSFGTWKKDDCTHYVWFHLLSKDVEVVSQTPTPNQSAASRQPFAQEDYNWLKPGFVLKIEHNRPASDSSESVATLISRPARVTLLGFGAATFRAGFENLAGTVRVDSLLEDPFTLLRVALAEMHRVIDNVGWHVSGIFRGIESDTLGSATTPVKAGELVNFARLHNLMKHGIYLQENCQAAIDTLDNLCAHYDEYMGRSPASLQSSTRADLKYIRTIFRSTQGRLLALDRRMANIVQLSFHLVTQGDSRIARSEALSMKVIAVVTLWFLPLGTVAGVFGTQLIKLDNDEPFHMQVSQHFWVLWVIATVLTLGVVGLWRIWYDELRAQLHDEEERRRRDERGWMGWKRLKRKWFTGGSWRWGKEGTTGATPYGTELHNLA